MENFYLAGDIGGTKTTLTIIDVEKGPNEFLQKETFASRDFSSLGLMASEFLCKTNKRIVGATFGIAGPVMDGMVQATNLPWLITETSLSKELSVPARILNDLTATAHAVPFLNDADLLRINNGTIKEHGTIGVVAPGTGLGEAYLTWNRDRYSAFSSEGGHTDFAPTSELQTRMLVYLQKKIGHVSYERVCSGRGLANIYDFLRNEGVYNEPERLRGLVDHAVDPAPEITKAALENSAEIATQTLKLFLSILGQECGNLALKLMATGGIYLGGGIPPRIIPLLEQQAFMASFSAKGRFQEILRNIPVYVIRNSEAALLGAACFGIEEWKSYGK